MAESEKCGVVDKGWNDPPPTAFTSVIRTPRNKLNQRIAFSNDNPPRPNEVAETKTNKPQLPPVCSSVNIKKSEVECDKELIELEPNDIEVVKSRFRSILTEHEEKLNKKTHDDITKRLQIMEQTWDDGKLNDTVQERLMQLSKALVNGDCDEANRIHLSLAVEYAGLVSPWLVGVKHLIQRAKKADPSS